MQSGHGGSIESGDKSKPFVQGAVTVGDEEARRGASAPPGSAPPGSAGGGASASAPYDDGGLVGGGVDASKNSTMTLLLGYIHTVREIVCLVVSCPHFFFFRMLRLPI